MEGYPISSLDNQSSMSQLHVTKLHINIIIKINLLKKTIDKYLKYSIIISIVIKTIKLKKNIKYILIKN